MALQVWLPLNGNLNNQGLTNTTVTNSGATVDNNGKIGKCYNFNSNKYLSVPNPITTSTTAFSISTWIYVTQFSNGFACVCSGRSSTSGAGIAFWVTPSYIRLDDGAMYIVNATISTGTWVHVCATWSSSKKSIYLNGQELGSSTSISKLANLSANMQIGSDASTTTTYCLNGKLNDFRIYDHALSPKEVEVLSRGLVCHYPLNGNGRGLPNLVKDSYLNRTSSSYSIAVLPFNPAPADNEQVTVSIKGQLGEGKWAWAIYNSGGNTEVTTVLNSDKVNGIYKKTFNWKVGSTSNTSMYIWVYSSSTVVDSTIEWVKLEKGDTATMWMPNEADTLYSQLGYDSTTEYDVSGYGYNGTKTGTFVYDVDTPRYSVCTNIKNAAYIKIQNLSTTGFSNSYSFAWWGKVPSYTGLMMWGFGDGMRLNGIFNGNLWNTGDGANNPLYVPGTTTQVTVPTTNVWHHWVMTGDGTTCKVYQDGELWATAKTYKSIGSGTTIYINGWDGSTNYKYNNYFMSDFRIYATALSADDIKELYDTVASVANNGTLLTRGEFIET